MVYLANQTLIDFISELDKVSKEKSASTKIADAYMKAARMSVSDDIKYALEQSNKAKKQIENVLINALNGKSVSYTHLTLPTKA